MNRWMAGADAQPVDSKMIEAQPARPVLLVGSVPFGSVAEVFEVVGANLGDLIRRVPDGEVGPRLEWIAWQKQTMGRATGIEIGGYREIQGGAVKYPQYKIKVGLNPEDVDFGSLGYAEAAKTSDAKFKELRDAGKPHWEGPDYRGQKPNINLFRVNFLARHPPKDPVDQKREGYERRK